MILHGLYDTLLKRQMGGWALAVALVALVGHARRLEPSRELEMKLRSS